MHERGVLVFDLGPFGAVPFRGRAIWTTLGNVIVPYWAIWEPWYGWAGIVHCGPGFELCDN